MSDNKLMLETTLRDAFRLAMLEYPKDRIKIEENGEDVDAAVIDRWMEDGGLWMRIMKLREDETVWTIDAEDIDFLSEDRWAAALRLASILRQRSLNPDYDFYFDGLRKGSGKQQQQQQGSDRNAETKTATQPKETQPGARSKDNGQG